MSCAPAIVTLRKVSEGEGDELAALRVEAMRESLERVGRFDPIRARERFLSGFSPEHTWHIVAGEERIGLVVLRPSRDDLSLDHLYIHPDHQGRGYGSAVLAMVFDEADRARKRVRVGALKQSRSNEFYARHGFELIEQGEWDDYYVRLPRSV